MKALWRCLSWREKGKQTIVIEEFEEQSLAKLCSEHVRKAEDELYTKYAGYIFSVCIRYCDNLDDAKDLMQEAFIKALDKIHTFKYRGKGSLLAWISRIAVNMALNKVRSRRLSFMSLETMDVDVVDELDNEGVSAIPEAVMLNMISELPPMKRAVFNMFCIDGYSHKEIASQLGLTEKGSASILSKAKSQLKDKVIRYLMHSERI
jgi:RNA polymerase sigma factor, sigma-70 family